MTTEYQPTIDDPAATRAPPEQPFVGTAGPNLQSTLKSGLRLSSAPSERPQLHGEIRELFYHRLREVAVLGGGTWWLLIAYCISGVDLLVNPARLGAICLGLMAAPTVAFPACFVWLMLRRGTSMFGLRVIEWVFVITTLVPLLALRYASVTAAMQMPLEVAGADALAARFATAYCNFPCTAMIIVYGVFVPNTYRRTLVMLSILAASLIAADVIAWLPQLPAAGPAFIDSTFQTSVMLFLSLGVAVYGSFKIGALQQEAQAAREQVRQLGQYRLIRPIGVGAMGEVHLAEHRLLKRPCAIKLIRHGRAGDTQALTRFEREVQATAKLTHPNVVEVYDYGHSDDGVFYYVMEYLEGLSLDELVRRQGRLPPGRALHLFRQLCAALREAHRNGLVHRDIKPSNVFVSRRGDVYDVVKLLDFGLVQATATDELAGRLTQAGGIVGTPEYMSPEQADTPFAVDGRSDIYALGGVLHFMLTGRPPFSGRTMVELLIAHRQQTLPPLRDLACEVSDELEHMLQRCMAKLTGARFADVAMLATAAEACRESKEWNEERSRQWWLSQPATSIGGSR